MRVRFWETAFIFCNLVVAGLLTASFISAEASSDPANANSSTPIVITPAPQYAEQQLTDISALVNALRAENGLKPLEQSQELDKVADLRAEDMSNNTYYAHRSSSGEFFDDIMAKQGIQNVGYACENLNMAETSVAGNFVDSWLNSPPHRQCLLDQRTDRAGYAITKIHISSGIPINQYVVVAIYTQTTQ